MYMESSTTTTHVMEEAFSVGLHRLGINCGTTLGNRDIEAMENLIHLGWSGGLSKKK
jgi:hypothetical protein